MSEPSKAELKRQIDREGSRWGLSHMCVNGDVLVGELQPCKIDLGCGLVVLEKVKRDITAMSTDYPFSSILRNRFTRTDRNAWLHREISIMNENKLQEQKLEPMYHEFKSDLRNVKRGRVIIGGK